MTTLNVTSETDRRIRLRDGRWLAYAEYGDPAGKPLVYAHGTPGSRLCRYPDESIALSLGARIIVPDRPGYGLSDFQPGRKLLDWPDDLVQLADALEIDRFAIYGFSGGGAYALACARRIPHRLTVVALINCHCPLGIPRSTSGMIWVNRLGFILAARVPWPIWSLITWLYFRNAHRDAGRFTERMAGRLPKCDREVFAQPGLREMLTENCREAFRAGTRGYAKDQAVIARSWDFRFEDINMKVHVWHGEENTRAPLRMGEYFASAIPDCEARFVSGEGHYIIWNRRRWKEILALLVS